MADDIKRMFVQDGTLHIVHSGKVWSVNAQEGKEPKYWPRVQFADVGTSAEFIEAFSGEMLELVDASTILDAERDAVKDAIMTVLVEGLMPAFEHLREIRQSASTSLPELKRRQLYRNFARELWHAYKDLFPKAVSLIGFEIGFLFTKDADFEKGLAAFMKDSPSLILNVPELMRHQRRNWHQALASFRNDHLEHRKKNIAEFAAFYQPKTAEVLFEHAWRTMTELLPAFIEARFLPMFSIMEIPPAERDPERLRRWRCFQCAPVDRGKFTRP